MNKNIRIKHILRSQQFSREILDGIFLCADSLFAKDRQGHIFDDLKGKILVSLFYEPSTRTRLSFESAMIKLGGKVIGTEAAKMFSSAVKGETLQDTIRIVSEYGDVIVLRHFEEGAAEQAAQVSKVPIINAGDGKGQHPTQSLLDLYTIRKEIGRLDNFRIAIVGDLASGRTARSLCYLLSKHKGIDIYFVSPKNLRMNKDILDYLKEKNAIFHETSELNEILPLVDIVYMTRIQKERISSKDYKKAKGKFVIDEKNFNLLRKDARLMHPLPHVEEISLTPELEQDRRVAYFRQARNGLYVRMALLKMLLA